jgi:hypothetical protein
MLVRLRFAGGCDWRDESCQGADGDRYSFCERGGIEWILCKRFMVVEAWFVLLGVHDAITSTPTEQCVKLLKAKPTRLWLTSAFRPVRSIVAA